MCGINGQLSVPPDGGYGWVVTFACALKKVIIIPIVFNFGLVLQKGYEETNVLPTQGNQVIVWRYTIEMLLSLFGGPLLQRFGYRKVAVVGSLLVFIALVLTSTARSFWQLVFYYSIILSIGEAASVPAFDLALNSFFKEKRARAIGIVTFCAGLGPMFIPLLMSNLLYSYGWRYTVLTLAAMSLHCLLAACLLRPAKWYAKLQSTQEEIVPLHNKTAIHMTTPDAGNPTTAQNNTFEDEHRVKFLRCLPRKLLINNRDSSYETTSSNISNKFQETSLLQSPNTETPKDELNVIHMDTESQKNKNNDKITVNKIISFFDLTLLKDPMFVNILCGLCIGPSVEVSFSLMLPIILKDMMQLETSDIATLMSVIAFSDVLFRLLGPYITVPWQKSPRAIYFVCLLASVVTRTAMLFTKSFNDLIYVALAMGISKGIRSTYIKVILPDYVPINRLAYAFGIVRFFRGITIFAIGEITSHVRNTTASYRIPIVILNIFTIITILMWIIEFIYLKLRKSVTKNETPINS